MPSNGVGPASGAGISTHAGAGELGSQASQPSATAPSHATGPNAATPGQVTPGSQPPRTPDPPGLPLAIKAELNPHYYSRRVDRDQYKAVYKVAIRELRPAWPLPPGSDAAQRAVEAAIARLVDGESLGPARTPT